MVAAGLAASPVPDRGNPGPRGRAAAHGGRPGDQAPVGVAASGRGGRVARRAAARPAPPAPAPGHGRRRNPPAALHAERAERRVAPGGDPLACYLAPAWLSL